MGKIWASVCYMNVCTQWLTLRHSYSFACTCTTHSNIFCLHCSGCQRSGAEYVPQLRTHRQGNPGANCRATSDRRHPFLEVSVLGLVANKLRALNGYGTSQQRLFRLPKWEWMIHVVHSLLCQPLDVNPPFRQQLNQPSIVFLFVFLV